LSVSILVTNKIIKNQLLIFKKKHLENIDLKLELKRANLSKGKFIKMFFLFKKNKKPL